MEPHVLTFSSCAVHLTFALPTTPSSSLISSNPSISSFFLFKDKTDADADEEGPRSTSCASSSTSSSLTDGDNDDGNADDDNGDDTADDDNDDDGTDDDVRARGSGVSVVVDVVVGGAEVRGAVVEVVVAAVCYRAWTSFVKLTAAVVESNDVQGVAGSPELESWKLSTML